MCGMTHKERLQLFYYTLLIQIRHVMSRAGAANFIAGRNQTTDCSESDACDVVIKMIKCIKIAQDRMGSMFGTIITTI